MAVRQDINVGLIAFVGLIGAMLLLIAFWGVEGWYAYEVNLLNTNRYEIDRNDLWLDRRDEQYANIGDPTGNDTIYAAAEVSQIPGAGYRYFSRERDAAAIPIHAAMAQIVAQYGGPQVSIEEMRAIDSRFVGIVNDAYADYMTPVPPPAAQEGQEPGAATPLTPPSTQPAPH
jgi:hypothetical protein